MNQLSNQLGNEQQQGYSAQLYQLGQDLYQPKRSDNIFQPSLAKPVQSNNPQQQFEYAKMQPTPNPLQRIPEESESPPKTKIRISEQQQQSQFPQYLQQPQQSQQKYNQQPQQSNDPNPFVGTDAYNNVFKKNADGVIVANFEDIMKYQQNLQTQYLAPKSQKIMKIIETSSGKP